MKSKSSINSADYISEAGIRRVNDVRNMVLPTSAASRSAEIFIKSTPKYYSPSVENRSFFSSIEKNKSLKDLKYFINLSASSLHYSLKESQFVKTQARGLVDSILKESESIESYIKEKEILYFKNSSNAHWNEFKKDKDQGLSEKDLDFTIDHKTRKRFEEKDQCSIIKGLGLTSPIETKYKVNVKKVEVINEGTTSGDTLLPYQDSNPNNCIIEGMSFDYGAVFKEIDSKRIYKGENAELTLCFTLSSLSYVNNIEVLSGSIHAPSIKQVMYLDAKNQTIQINDIKVNGTFEISLLFLPVEAKAFLVVFEQTSPIYYGEVKEKDSKLEATLERSGMVSGTKTNKKDINGYVYDLSVSSVKFNLIRFSERGIFRSEYTQFSNLQSLRIDLNKTFLNLEEYYSQYFLRKVIENTSIPVEAYCGLKFFDFNGELLGEEIAPLIDSNPKQIEYLELSDDIMRLKLYPDIFSKTSQYLKRIDLFEDCVRYEDIVESLTEEEIKEHEEAVENLAGLGELKDIVLTSNQSDFNDIGLDFAETKNGVVSQVRSMIKKNQLVKTIDNGFSYTRAIIKKADGSQRYLILKVEERNNQVEVSLEKSININYVQSGFKNRAAVMNLNYDIQNSEKQAINGTIIDWSQYAESTFTFPKKGYQTNDVPIESGSPTVHNPGDIVLTKPDETEEPLIEISPEDPQCLLYTAYYYFTFNEEHNLLSGDSFTFFLESVGRYITGIVFSVSDAFTVKVLPNGIPPLPVSSVGVDLSPRNSLRVNAAEFKSLLEIWKNEELLELGRDYLISFDNGSNWYDYIPNENSIKYKIRKACAGDFLIKLKSLNRQKEYIAKYKVLKNQFLVKSKRILLKNGILKIKEPYNSCEGIASAIIVIRENTGNKYKSQIVTDYSMSLFEDKPVANKKALKYNKSLQNTAKRNSGNVN